MAATPNSRPGEKAPNVFGRGSAILADGKLIALGEAGLLGLFKPNPDKLEEIARWQVPQAAAIRAGPRRCWRTSGSTCATRITSSATTLRSD